MVSVKWPTQILNFTPKSGRIHWAMTIFAFWIFKIRFYPLLSFSILRLLACNSTHFSSQHPQFWPDFQVPYHFRKLKDWLLWGCKKNLDQITDQWEISNQRCHNFLLRFLIKKFFHRYLRFLGGNPKTPSKCSFFKLSILEKYFRRYFHYFLILRGSTFLTIFQKQLLFLKLKFSSKTSKKS